MEDFHGGCEEHLGDNAVKTLGRQITSRPEPRDGEDPGSGQGVRVAGHAEPKAAFH